VSPIEAWCVKQWNPLLYLHSLSKTTPHTATELADGFAKITIIHPFHPDKGKAYEFLGKVKKKHVDYVRCLCEHGEVRLFPLTFTDLFIAATPESSNTSDCVMSLDDLLSLKNVVEAILNSLKV
jgi:hypothetical protein